MEKTPTIAGTNLARLLCVSNCVTGALVKNRLLHFCVIGAAIFALAPSESRSIELSSKMLASLAAAEASRATHAARSEVDARAIEDELLYREALRLSLDKGDPIVRQRLIQKLLLLAEDIGGASRAPTEAELGAYYAANRARLQPPSRLHFIHVFAARRDALPPVAVLSPSDRLPPSLGEAFPWPRDVIDTREQIATLYGPALRDAVEHADGWSEPVASSFGWHRVRLVERLPAAPTPFAEMKKRFEVEFVLARREQIIGSYLRKLARDYRIHIDGRPVVGFVPTSRVARRVEPSAED